MTSPFDLVLHHGNNCPDGLAAAWCFWRHQRTLELIPMKYDDPAPDVTGRSVMVLDFSFSREVTEQLARQAVRFEVQDHHESARVRLAGLAYCEFDMTRAGCEMAWDCVEGKTVARPWWLSAIADHDVWRKNEESEAICASLTARGLLTLESFDWLTAHPELRHELLFHGRELHAATLRSIEPYIKSSYLASCQGYRVRVTFNCPDTLVSHCGNQLCLRGDCDFAVLLRYQFETNSWAVSLRGVDKVDLTVVAVQINVGGGHKNASGAVIYGEKGQSPWTYVQPL